MFDTYLAATLWFCNSKVFSFFSSWTLQSCFSLIWLRRSFICASFSFSKSFWNWTFSSFPFISSTTWTFSLSFNDFLKLFFTFSNSLLDALVASLALLTLYDFKVAFSFSHSNFVFKFWFLALRDLMNFKSFATSLLFWCTFFWRL